MANNPSQSNPVPVAQPTFKKEDFSDNLSYVNQWVQSISESLNRLTGFSGPIKLANGIDLNGKRIQNVGEPIDDTDVVTKVNANSNYGASALQPSFEALGKQVFQTTRRLNDTFQREQTSSYMNDLASTSPAANTAKVTFGSPSGGTVAVNISSGYLQRVDKSIVPFGSFNDTLSLTGAFGLSALSRSAGVVSAFTSSANPFVTGETVVITGVSDASFDGTFVITNIVNSSEFQFIQAGPSASTTGGTATLGGVFYYYLAKGKNVLNRTNTPFGAGDAMTSRVGASYDGQVLIAVVAISGSGGVVANSAGGGDSPSTGGNTHIMFRI